MWVINNEIVNMCTCEATNKEFELKWMKLIRHIHLSKLSVYFVNTDVFTPPFVELTCEDMRTNSLRLRNAGITYPFGKVYYLYPAAFNNLAIIELGLL